MRFFLGLPYGPARARSEPVSHVPLASQYFSKQDALRVYRWSCWERLLRGCSRGSPPGLVLFWSRVSGWSRLLPLLGGLWLS